MAAPDNRLRFSSTKIDFATDVGLSGQDHDNYPPPQGQARFDHMRMLMIALLSQQSSFAEPTEYRDGTPWYDLNSETLKIWQGEWKKFSEAIPVGLPDGLGLYTTLEEWYDAVNAALTGVSQEVVFNGSSTADGIQSIEIPLSLRPFVYDDTRCFVHKNGLFQDPRNHTILGGITIKFSNYQLDIGDNFTVVLKRVPDNSFYTPSVTV
tara:strand:+ start:2426 stop:3049 length:624 start_codon:yes stop_codon:yes gene_type:complete